MKLILSLCALFIFFYSITSCSKHGDALPSTPEPKDTLMAWQKITGPIKSAQDIWFANAAKGFVCDTGAIYSSSDSGKTWVAAPGITNHSYYLSFFNAQIGASVGSQDLYTTVNGGLSWSKKTFPLLLVQQSTANIQMTSASTAWLCKPDGLFKSTDTCNTWNKVFTSNVNGIFFFNNNEGFLFNTSGTTNTPVSVYHTSDGAANWQAIGNPSGNAPGNNIMQFTDKMHGWLIQSNALYGTTDGGATWLVKFSAGDIRDVQFLDSQTGYVARYNEIYKTTDGGQTWTRSCRTGTSYIWEIFFLDANTGWACCDDGSILRLKQ